MAKKRKPGKRKEKVIEETLKEAKVLGRVENIVDKARKEYGAAKTTREWLKILDILVLIIIIALIVSAYSENFLSLVFFLVLGTGILVYILMRLTANKK